MVFNKTHIVDAIGNFVPFFVSDFKYVDIRTNSYDPCTNETGSNIEKYLTNGFLVRPDTDGSFYGITWSAYQNNNKSFVGLEPQTYLASANQWIECAFTKVYAKNDASFGNASSFINIGI